MRRRDKSLIRALMFKLEEIYQPGVYYSISMYDDNMQVVGFSSDEIHGHLKMLDEMGYLLKTSSSPMNGIAFKGFTGFGHDYLDEQHEEIESDRAGERVSEATLALLREAIADLRSRICSLESNSAKSEIEADLSQIAIEVERPEPRRSSFRAFIDRLREDLIKVGTHELVTEGLHRIEAIVHHMGWF